MPGTIQCFTHLFISYTNLNSCNAGTYSVTYALIYWLFMLCLPLFLGDSSYSRRDKLYLELLQCWDLFSDICTYLLVIYVVLTFVSR